MPKTSYFIEPKYIMSDSIVRIATRKSPLALWQAHHVRQALCDAHPGLQVELLEMVTKGDKILDTPLAKIGGKGLFVKELEEGLLAGEADIAVHSMKDVGVDFPEGLHLPIIMKREDPRDAFVSNTYDNLFDLPAGAIVGTASLRRQSQILALRPDLQIRTLRGNVGTRLGKLDAGEYDAIILAAAGLRRLEKADRISSFIESSMILPAVGQGAVGIECRVNDERIEALLAPLNDAETAVRVRAERAINRRLEGGCQVPIAGFAEVKGEQISIRGLVADPQGQKIYRADAQGTLSEAEALGDSVAQDLLQQGAGEILAQLMDH